MRDVGFGQILRRLCFIALGILPFVLGGGCSSSEDKPGYVAPGNSGGKSAGGSGGSTAGTGGSAGEGATGGTDGTGGIQDGAGGSGAADAGSDVSEDGANADAADSSDSEASAANCGSVVCRGHGKCVNGECICDTGYVLKDDISNECVVDETCIKVRYLDDSCRQLLNGAPAVGLFFAVDYCAGTAVLPDKVKFSPDGGVDGGPDLGIFTVLEDGVDIKQNPESSATVVARDVENYVTLAVDVSKSLSDNVGLLNTVGDELIKFVQALEPQSGEPSVGISVVVFGRFAAEYVAPTTDFASVVAALNVLKTSPATVQLLVGADGTALYDGTKKAIRATERMQRLRSLVTNAGVLTTGVTVVVTDGKDTSGATLDKTLISQTLVNVISVGVSSDIDDADLTAIGRDGSFLAPATADISKAFEEITQRVKDAPDRAYLLAYCSSATSGSRTVTVTTGPFPPKQTATCKFNADLFSSDPLDVCSLKLFEKTDPKYLCTGKQCGGLLACGACANAECCGGDAQCHGPSATPGECQNQDEPCAKAGQVCVKADNDAGIGSWCRPPLQVGQNGCPTNADCDPGQAYCESNTCLDVTKVNGDACETATGTPRAEVCPELNCARTNLENPFETATCRPRARMFDACSGTGAAATCESGSSCRNATCQPRKPLASSCAAGNECRSAVCDAQGKICDDTSFCFFSWDEKMQF